MDMAIQEKRALRIIAVITAPFVLWIVLFLSNPAFGQSAADGPAPLKGVAAPRGTDEGIDRERLSFEREKHFDTIAIEREKMALERNKAWASGLSVMVPLLAAAGTIAFGIWSQGRQAKLARQARQEESVSEFELKAAEIVMSAPGPLEARNRALALKALFRQRLTEDFADKFDPKDYGRLNAPEGKKELLRLVAAHPEGKDEILTLWWNLFPGDTWLEALLPLPKTKNSDGENDQVAQTPEPNAARDDGPPNTGHQADG